MKLLSGHEKIITKSGISLNAGTLNRCFTVYSESCQFPRLCIRNKGLNKYGALVE
jgi:hypothetical protein